MQASKSVQTSAGHHIDVEHLFVFPAHPTTMIGIGLLIDSNSAIGSALDFNFELLGVRSSPRVKVESENLNVTIRAIN